MLPLVLLLIAVLLAVLVLLGIGWQSRVRTLGRWLDALDAYADREMARTAGWKIRRKVARI
jgi:hypothetical protein